MYTTTRPSKIQKRIAMQAPPPGESNEAPVSGPGLDQRAIDAEMLT
ncbi:hypothetical protein [Variovorax rhizosphaerae]|uniref:Uncharacterized protein n=1 Tax=Variovorax rhizosphaerae TaxID=1836200 RepID=A0ABU8WE68_9BURK